MISVIVPNYNHSSYLEERLNTVFNQTYQDFEVILLDDNSTDNSVVVLNKYKNHPKVSHISFNTKNSGSPFGMWQQGFDLANGDYIWIAESDDFSELNFLKTLIAKIDKENVVVAHCRSYNYKNHNKETKLNSWWNSFKTDFWDSDYLEDGRVLLEKYGKYKCPVINVSSALIKKSALKNVEIPTKYRYCGDWWFWAQLFISGNIAYSSRTMNYIRIHENSVTNSKSTNVLLKIEENIKVIKNISKLLEQKVVYNENYSWLLLFLVSKTKNERRFLNFKYLFPKMPLLFLINYHILLAKVLVNKFK